MSLFMEMGTLSLGSGAVLGRMEEEIKFRIFMLF
jgi:hypothetical protein